MPIETQLPIVSVVALGFLLGMRHATDPDHVVAVAAIVSRERTLRAAAPIGLLWGVGHTTTIVAVGVAIIVFGVVIPPRLGLGMEFSVSLMLVGLGAYNLATLARRRSTSKHGHGARGLDVGLEKTVARGAGATLAGRIRPLAVGIVHGLAGSAAVALLVLGTIRTSSWAVAYLFVFGVGTVAGMLLVTTLMALPVAFSARRFERVHRGILLVSALVSLAFGTFLVYEIGFVHGLFSANPAWTPQ